MKNIRPVMRLCVTGLFLLGLSASLHVQAGQLGTAKVVQIKGSARYMIASGGTWQPLTVGTVVTQGAIIQTADASYADLVLNDTSAKSGLENAPNNADANRSATASTAVSQNESMVKQDAIRVLENSVLSVEKLSVTQTGADAVTDTELDLKAGTLFGTVKKLSPASTYEIKIPTGVAAVRGTVYMISAGGVVDVLSGKVLISYVRNGVAKVATVAAGQQFDPKTGIVSRIPERTLERLQEIVENVGSKALTKATTFTKDNTVYNVSPVKTKP
jgi:hypothetical protein